MPGHKQAALNNEADALQYADRASPEVLPFFQAMVELWVRRAVPKCCFLLEAAETRTREQLLLASKALISVCGCESELSHFSLQSLAHSDENSLGVSCSDLLRTMGLQRPMSHSSQAPRSILLS